MGDVVAITKPQTFEDFWKVCPKKVGKAIAQAKYNEIVSEKGLTTRTLDRDSGLYVELVLHATPEELIKGMQNYRSSQIDTKTFGLKDDGKWTCGPAVWLNQGRWMDSP